MSEFFDFINKHRAVGGEAAVPDYFDQRIEAKKARLEEKQKEMFAPQSIPLTGTSSNDGDNINHVDLTAFGLGKDSNVRTIGRDGSGYGAWETRKPDSYYNDPVYGAQRRRQLDGQRAELASRLGLRPEEITREDVWRKGDEAKLAFRSNLLAGSDLQGGRNQQNDPSRFKATFLPSQQKDKSQGGNSKRVLGRVFNALGQDVADLSNTYENNPDYDGKFNKNFRQVKENEAVARQEQKDVGQQFDDKTLRDSVAAEGVNFVSKIAGGLFVDAPLKALRSPFNRAAASLDNDSTDLDKQKFFEATKARDKFVKDRYGDPSAYDKLDKDTQNIIDATVYKGLSPSAKELIDRKPVKSKTSIKDSVAKFGEDLVVAGSKEGTKGVVEVISTALSTTLLGAVSGHKDDPSKSKAYNNLKKQEALYRSSDGLKRDAESVTKYLKSPFVDDATKTHREGVKAAKDTLIRLGVTERFDKGTATEEDYKIASAVSADTVANSLKAFLTPSVAASTVGDSLGQIIATSMTGGLYGLAIFDDALTRNERAFKKNNKGVNAKGLDAVKHHAYAGLETAIQIGAGEFMLGRAGKAVFGNKKINPVGYEINQTLNNLGVPTLRNKSLEKSLGKNSSKDIIKTFDDTISNNATKVGDLSKSIKDKEVFGKTLDTTLKRVVSDPKRTSFKQTATVQDAIKKNNKELSTLNKQKDSLINSTNKANKDKSAFELKTGLDPRFQKVLDKKTKALETQKGILTNLEKSLPKGTLNKSQQALSDKLLNPVKAKITALEQNLAKISTTKQTNIDKAKLFGKDSIDKLNAPAIAKAAAEMSKPTKKFMLATSKVLNTTPGKLLTGIARASSLVATGGVVEFGEEFTEELLGQLGTQVGQSDHLDFAKATEAGLAGLSAGAGISSTTTLRQEGKTLAVEGTKTALITAGIGLVAGAAVLGAGVKGVKAGVNAVRPNTFSNINTKPTDANINVSNGSDVNGKPIITNVAIPTKSKPKDIQKHIAGVINNKDISEEDTSNFINDVDTISKVIDSNDEATLNHFLEQYTAIGNTELSKLVQDNKDSTNTGVFDNHVQKKAQAVMGVVNVVSEKLNKVKASKVLKKDVNDITDEDVVSVAKLVTGNNGSAKEVQDALNRLDQEEVSGTLSTKAKTLLTAAKNLQASVNASTTSLAKSFTTVASEVLGTEVNSTNGKPALGTHLANINAAVSLNDTATIEKSTKGLYSFANAHNKKLQSLNHFLKNGKKGETYDIPQGGSYPFGAQAQALKNVVQEEVGILNDAVVYAEELTGLKSGINKQYTTPVVNEINDSEINPNEINDSEINDFNGQGQIAVTPNNKAELASAVSNKQVIIPKTQSETFHNNLVKSGYVQMDNGNYRPVDSSGTVTVVNTGKELTTAIGNGIQTIVPTKQVDAITAKLENAGYIKQNNGEFIKGKDSSASTPAGLTTSIGNELSSTLANLTDTTTGNITTKINDGNGNVIDSVKSKSEYANELGTLIEEIGTITGSGNPESELKAIKKKLANSPIMAPFGSAIVNMSNLKGGKEIAEVLTVLQNNLLQSKDSDSNITIEGTSKFNAKDKVKFKDSNKLIAYGEANSSTGRYASSNPQATNTGTYKSTDVVAVSLNGSTRPNSQQNYSKAITEVNKAMTAGATIVTDIAGTNTGNRDSSHNTATEGKLAKHLLKNGYQDTNGDGKWKPDPSGSVVTGLQEKAPNVSESTSESSNNPLIQILKDNYNFKEDSKKNNYILAKDALAKEGKAYDPINDVLYEVNDSVDIDTKLAISSGGKLSQEIANNNAAITKDIKAKVSNVTELAQWVADNAPNEAYSSISKGIVKYLKDNNLKGTVNFEDVTKAYSVLGTGKAQRSVTAPGNIKTEGTNNTITFSENTVPVTTVMHELVHAVTAHSLNADPNSAVAKNLNKVLKASTNAANSKGEKYYGNSNVFELIAEINDEKFSKHLAGLPSVLSNNKNSSLLTDITDSIKQTISKLFNVPTKELSLLDDVIGAIDTLTNQSITKANTPSKAVEAVTDGSEHVDIDSNSNDTGIGSVTVRKLSKLKVESKELAIKIKGEFNTQLNAYRINSSRVGKDGKVKSQSNMVTFKDGFKIASLTSSKVFGILSTGTRDTNALQEVYNLDSKDLKYIGQLNSHLSYFSNILDSVLPTFDTSLDLKDSNYLTERAIYENPLLMFYSSKRTENVPQYLKDAITVGVRNWMSNGGTGSLFNSKENINSMLGNNQDFTLNTQAFNKLHKAGTLQSEVVDNLGQAIFQSLNIKQNKDIDGILQDKLVQSLGTIALAGMQHSGMVELSYITNGELDQYREVASKNPQAEIFFVKATNQPSKEGNFVEDLSDVNQSFVDQDSDNSDLVNELFGTTNTQVVPVSDKPIQANQVETLAKNSIVSLSKSIFNAILKAGQVEYRLHEGNSKLFNNISIEGQKKMLGFVEDTDRGHEHYEASRQGSNLSITNAIQQYKDWTETNKDGLHNKPLFFMYRMWKNNRMGITANEIDPQANKLHRFLFNAKSWTEEVNFDVKSRGEKDYVSYLDANGDRKQILKKSWMKRSILLGMDKDLVVRDAVRVFNKDFVGTDGEVKTSWSEDLPLAIEAINSGNKFTAAQESAVLAVIKKGGEKTHSLAALQNMAAISKALKSKGKVTSVIKISMPHEIDGTTNGSILSTIQIPHNVEEAKFILRKGGIFFTKDPWNSYSEFKGSKNQITEDNYEALARRVLESLVINPEILKSLLPEGQEFQNEGLQELFNLAMPTFLKDGQITPLGRKFAKPFLMTSVYSKGNSSRVGDIKAALMDGIYEQIGDINNTIATSKDPKKVQLAYDSLNSVNNSIAKYGTEMVHNIEMAQEGMAIIQAEVKAAYAISKEEGLKTFLSTLGAKDALYSMSVSPTISSKIELKPREFTAAFNKQKAEVIEENVKYSKGVFIYNKDGSMLQTYLPPILSYGLVNRGAEVYGTAVNSAIQHHLGDFVHSRTLLNAGVRYASTVANMIYKQRVVDLIAEKAEALGRPGTHVPLTIEEGREILTDMLKKGQLNTTKHSLSSKGANAFIDSILVQVTAKENVPADEGGEVRLELNKKGSIQRSPVGGGEPKSYKNIKTNVKRRVLQDDTGVKPSIGLTISMDGNIQGILMEKGYDMLNLHDAQLVKSSDSIAITKDANKALYEMVTDWGQWDAVEETVLRANKNMEEFRLVNPELVDEMENSLYNLDGEGVFGDFIPRIPLYSKAFSSYFEGADFNSINSDSKINTANGWINSNNFISAIVHEASHIRTNKTELINGIRYIEQYANGGFGYSINDSTRIDMAPYNKATEKARDKQITAIAKITGNSLPEQLKNTEKAIDNSALDAFRTESGGDTQGNSPADSADPFRISDFKDAETKTVDVATLGHHFRDLEKHDLDSSVEVSESHKEYMNDYASTVLTGLFKHVKAFNFKHISKGSKTLGAFSSSKETIYVRSALATAQNSPTNMSSQETYLHELTHPVWKILFIKDKASYGKVANILQQVTKGANAVTYTDLLDNSLENSTKAEIAEAKKNFRYIFQNKDISEFATFAVTNEKVMKAISKIKTKLLDTSKESITLLDKLVRLLENGINLLFSGKTADKAMFDLVSNINSTDLKSKRSTTTYNTAQYTDKLNTKASQTMINRVVKPVSNLITKLDSQHKLDAKTIPGRVVQGSLALVTSPVSILIHATTNKEFAISIEEGLSTFQSNTSIFVRSLLTESKGTTVDSKKYEDILRLAKKNRDGTATQTASGVSNQIKEMFDEENQPESKDFIHFTKAALDTDLQVIVDDYTPIELANLISSDSNLDAKASELKTKLVSTSSNRFDYYNSHAENLGYYLVHGNSTNTNHTILNAHNIANMNGVELGDYSFIDKLDKDDTNEAETLIDQLATIYALKETSKESRDVLAKFLKSENKKAEGHNAIGFMLNLNRANNKTALKRNFNGKKALMTKGYSARSSDENKHGKVALISDTKLLESQGYVLESTINDSSTGSPKGYFYNPAVVSSKFTTGIVSLADTKASGQKLSTLYEFKDADKQIAHTESLKRELNKELNFLFKRGGFPPVKDGNKFNLAPVMNNNGELVDYKYLTDTVTKDKLLKVNNHAAELIGSTMGGVITRVEGKNYNRQLVDIMAKDFEDSYSKEPHKFITMNASEGTTKNQELFTLLPKDMKRHIKRKFGDKEFQVRQDYINLIFGFKNKSLANSGVLRVFGKDGTTGRNRARRVVHHTEKLWQAFVSTAKTNIVILDPAVLIANTVSNQALLTMKGIPPNIIYKYEKEALLGVVKYKNDSKELDELKTLLRVDPKHKGVRSTKVRIDKLQNLLEHNHVHEMVQDGLLQAIVEDVAENNTPILKAGKDIINTVSGERTSDILDKVNSALDKFKVGKGSKSVSLLDAYKTLTISPDTELASHLRSATQFSDLVARYALIEYRKTQGVSKEEALSEALETFVNYDINTSAELQWVNDMGLMMFTKYFIRTQKVLLGLMKDKPLNVVALESANMALGSPIPTVFDSHLFRGTNVNLDPENILSNVFQFNLLKYLPF